MSAADSSTRSSLISRVRDLRDADAWCQFEAVYKPLIRRYIASRGVPASEIDDIVQEVFARLTRALPGFDYDRGKGRFRSWLWQVTMSVLADQARRRLRQRQAEAQWAEQFLRGSEHRSGELEAEWRRQYRLRVLEEVLCKVRASTPPKMSACFELCMLNGLNGQQAAERLGLTVGTVYVYVSQVMSRVRQMCRDYDEELQDE